MTVLTVLAALESTLPSFCLSYEIHHDEATVAVLTDLAVSAVMAVSVMTAYFVKLNPLRDPDCPPNDPPPFTTAHFGPPPRNSLNLFSAQFSKEERICYIWGIWGACPHEVGPTITGRNL